MRPRANDGGLDDRFRSGLFEARRMDELFDLLAATERRAALQCLATARGATSFDELVHGTVRLIDAEPAGRERRKQVATTLHHVHLPKLEAAGLVEVDASDDEVRLTESARELPIDLFESI